MKDEYNSDDVSFKILRNKYISYDVNYVQDDSEDEQEEGEDGSPAKSVVSKFEEEDNF